MSKRSWFYAFVCAIFCSAAIALQPTVRAGSISLSSTAKPNTNAVTPANAASVSAATTNRGSALSKFSQGAVVPVSTNQSNNNSVSSSVLAELQSQIDALKTAQATLADRQADLEDSQSETSSVVESVTTQVQSISSTNTGLTNAVSDLQTSNNSLQSALNTIQSQTEALGDSLNSNIDSRLQYRGLLDSGNNLAFATKNEINPETLALRIAANPTATATLSEKITPKETDIQRIIRDDLIERQILDNTGNLNVEKKGQVQVTTATVTEALNDSPRFKELVSEAATEKGFVTDTVLNTKGFVTANSETIANLASKTELETLKTKVDGDVDSEGSLLNTIRENESIRRVLKGDKGDKGDQGTSANVDDVVNALKRDADFINNTKAQDATTAWYEYCTTDNNLSNIIQQLYPSVTNCDDFTSDQFNKMMNGPKGQCLSWAVSPDELQKNSGIGLKLTNMFGSNIIDNLKSYHVGTKIWVSSTPVNFVDVCAQRYDEIMKPDDPKTVEKAYCEAQAENYASGITNLTIIRKIYPSVSSCDQFTFEMYTAITNGAKAYCISLATNQDNLDATSGVGLKLEKTFGAGIVEALRASKLETLVNGQNFVEVCENNYNEIMSGQDATSVWQLYCEAQADNYPEGITNLTLIQKLFSDANVGSCKDFTKEQYAIMTAGAKEYCLNLNATFNNNVSVDDGIGLKLAKLYVEKNSKRSGTVTLAQAKTALQTLQGKTAVARLDDKVFDGQSLFDACVDNYNKIMAGDDGKDAKSVEQTYCEENLEIVKKLYPNNGLSVIADCADTTKFSNEEYSAIMGGSKAYCLSLAKDPSVLGDLSSGIGKKLSTKLGTKMADFIDTTTNNTTEKRLALTGFKGKNDVSTNFMTACEAKYDEIMSGKDGEDAETAWHAYCEEIDTKINANNTLTNLDRVIKPLYGNDKTCDNFTSDEYNAIMGGAKAYCLSLATDPSKLADSDNNITKKLKKTFGDDIVTKLGTSGAGTMVVSTRNRDGSANEAKFVDECERRYDEIMSGDSAKSVEQIYCETDNNLVSIIQPLYGSNKSNGGVETCDDFTQDQYKALMGGSKEYCMLIAKNAKSDSDYLVATKGVGKTLENIFGSGTVQNLKNNGLNASIGSKKFVFACAEKYDEIMNPKSAWYSYCSEGTNLTTIIQPLYGSDTAQGGVTKCEDFTQEQYNALMGGPKAYCLLVAKDVSASTSNVKSNLKKLFGDNIVTRLTTSKVATEVEINGETMKFVDACAKKYEEIMAGKSGEGYNYKGEIANYSALSTKTCDTEHEKDAWYNKNDKLLYICACNNGSCTFPADGGGIDIKGEPGENGKPASQLYCEAQADNYPSGTKNLTLIKKLYPAVTSCDPTVFTEDKYAAIIGGAKSYCLSLNANFNSGMDLENGIGLKMAKIYAKDKSVSLADAKTALTTLKAKNAAERLNDSDFSILDKCIANYNHIMSGDDAETAWHAYCEEIDTKINPNNTANNLERIIKPLYGNDKTCDNFTSDEYNAIMGGAKAYCLSLATDPSKLSNSDSNITKKLKKTFGDDIVTKLGTSGAGTMVVSTRNRDGSANEAKFVDECERRYDEIMSGDNAKSTEQTYCETNFTTVSALYSSINEVAKCSEFTATQYKAMMEGAKAYCLLLAQDFANNKLVSTSGIGKKMNEKLKIGTSTTDGIFSLSNKSLSSVLTTKYNGNTDDFLSACEKNYNEIMAGEKGDNAKSAEQTYCEANSADVIALFNNNNANPKITSASDCPKFTAEQYKAMTSGAKSYCLLLAKDFSAGKLTLEATSDTNKAIARKMNQKLKIGNTDNGILSMNDKSLSTVLTTKFNGDSDDFLTACEKTYNEIMAGDKGESGEDAVTTWCKEHTTSLATGDAKLSAAKMVRAYDKLGGNSTAAAKINTTTGRFNSLEDCINAVKADPSLMGGDSAADEDFNEDNKGKTITLTQETKTTLEGKKTKFQKVVTEDNIGTQLRNNTTVKTALQDAGFASKTEVTSDALTMEDLSDLLSGGLIVDDTGKVRLDANVNNTKSKAIQNKLTSAKSRGLAIENVTGMTAATTIASSVANLNVSAAAATTGMDSTKCAALEYMFWWAPDGSEGSCTKCPDGTRFNSESMKNSALPRCVCEDESTTFNSNAKGQEQFCIKAEGNECLKKNGTYLLNGSQCKACPAGTYFNEKAGTSIDNNANRCLCRDGLFFNPNVSSDAYEEYCTKTAPAGSSSSCPAATYLNTRSNECTSCAKAEGARVNENGQCVCDDGVLNTYLGVCMHNKPEGASTFTSCDDPNAAVNPIRWMCMPCEAAGASKSGDSCVCNDPSLTLNLEEWRCMQAK